MVSGTSRYVEGNLARALPRAAEQRKAKAAVRKNPMATIALVAIVCVGLGLTFLAQNAATARLSYQNAQLNQQIDQLARENSELELRVEQLGSLERIEKAAGRLGMVSPTAVSAGERAGK